MFSSSWMFRAFAPIHWKFLVSRVSSCPPPKRNWQVQHFQNCGRGLVAKGATVRPFPCLRLELPWFAPDAGCTFLMVTPLKINVWNLKITQLKRKIIFQISILGFQMLILRGVSPEDSDFRWFSMVEGLYPPFNWPGCLPHNLRHAAKGSGVLSWKNLRPGRGPRDFSRQAIGQDLNFLRSIPPGFCATLERSFSQRVYRKTPEKWWLEDHTFLLGR